MIKSLLLYQLSYRGEAGRDSSEFNFGCHFAAGLFFPWQCTALIVAMSSRKLRQS